MPGTGDQISAVRRIGKLLMERGATLAVAESCTGGMFGSILTAVSGSSGYFVGGVTAYADKVKIMQLGVAPGLLRRHGAVSRAVAVAMAEGVRRGLGADYGVGITGVAGPLGGSAKKPVGLVYLAVARRGGFGVQRFRFSGGRQSVRRQACARALDLLRGVLTKGARRRLGAGRESSPCR